MKELLFYTATSILLIYYFGSGLTLLLVPNKLKNFAFWLTPWYSIVVLILVLIIGSLVGFSVYNLLPFLFIIFGLVNYYSFIVKNKRFNFIWLRDLFILLVIGFNILFNLSPIFIRDKFTTTISFGNNDVVAYAATSEYLIRHTIRESFYNKSALPVETLLLDGYRWGTPIIESLFLATFNIKGYEFTYLIQVVLFALMLPLTWILLSFFNKKTKFSYLIVIILTGFNVNLLYMLYHNFFGQVLYWGLSIFFLILIFEYFSNIQKNNNKVNINEIMIGASVASLFFSYHEPLVFMLFPLSIFLITNIRNKKTCLQHFLSLLKIAAITFLISSYSLINAVVFDFKQAFRMNPNQPIGWQLFRKSIPFANPFEALGFWSIHSFEPIPIIFAVIFSILALAVIFQGIINVKHRKLVVSYVLIFLFFYLYTAVFQENFFTYNRALTYTLPLIIILFVVGLENILEKKILFKFFIYVFLFSLLMNSAVQLNKRFINERISVDYSLISLNEVVKLNISEQIYHEGMFYPNISIWKKIWIEYFIYPLNSRTLRFDFSSIKDIPNNSLVLTSKSVWQKGTELIYSSIVWENDFYQLGRICNSDSCLLDSSFDYSRIKFGKNDFEDSLLLSGWSGAEIDGRWANDKIATLRLVSIKNISNKIVVEAQSLSEPQTLSIEIDGQKLKPQNITSNWNKYTFMIPKKISKGVHYIVLNFSNTYSPAEIIGNGDQRKLSIRFKELSLE